MTDSETNIVPFAPRPRQPEPEPVRKFTEFFLDPQTFGLTLTLGNENGDSIAVFRFTFCDVSPSNFDMRELLEHWTGLKDSHGCAS